MGRIVAAGPLDAPEESAGGQTHAPFEARYALLVMQPRLNGLVDPAVEDRRVNADLFGARGNRPSCAMQQELDGVAETFRQATVALPFRQECRQIAPSGEPVRIGTAFGLFARKSGIDDFPRRGGCTLASRVERAARAIKVARRSLDLLGRPAELRALPALEPATPLPEQFV